MSTIEEELRRLAAVAVPLQQATEQANAAIQQANVGIGATAPGIEIWLKKVIPGEAHDSFGFGLGVSKVKGSWQVAARACHMDGTGDSHEPREWIDEPFPLTEASRELRLVGAALLPELIRALTEECQRLLSAKQRVIGAP